MLDITKGAVVDLNKETGKTLTKLRLGAGWDMADSNKTLDLDLWLIAKGQDPLYFNHKSIPGATLDKDDRTGASSAGGADENIQIDVAGLTADEYVVMVNIYEAVNKGQFFRDVKSAFVEIEDVETKNTIFKFNISENGGDNSSLVVGKLLKKNGGLEFTAMTEFSTKPADVVVRENGGNA